MAMDYIMEPFKIKTIEPLKKTTREQRIESLKQAHYNVFNVRSDDVFIDMQTDSGTGAMSQNQWAAIMTADEAYGGARGYYQVRDAVQDIFHYKFAQPIHQGRACEKILFPCLDLGPGKFAISNSFFTTTRGHVELTGARGIDCICEEAKHIDLDAPFKGNMDVVKLENIIQEKGAKNVGVIVMTITNNSAGGQPVSMANVRATSEIAKKYDIPFVIDAARYAENAYFIKTREPGYESKSIKEIVRECFSYADAFTMSAKKDTISNMGGCIGVREDEKLFRKVELRTIPNEGFLTYGGLSGRDIAAMAVGFYEGIDEEYLTYRIGQVQYFGELLHDMGIPIQYPVGGHAVFLDAGQILPHLSWTEYPSQALTAALYIEGGVRGSDIGTMSKGRDPDTHEENRADVEFCRLCLARRVYTQSQLEHAARTVKYVADHASQYPGYRILEEAPVLRHFTVKLEPTSPLR